MTSRTRQGEATLPVTALPAGREAVDALRDSLAEQDVRLSHVELLDADSSFTDKAGVLTLTFAAVLPVDTEQPNSRLQFIPYTEARQDAPVAIQRLFSLARRRSHEQVQELSAMVELVGQPFSIPDLRRAYECMLGTALNPGNFAHRVQPKESDHLVPAGDTKRPARNIGRPSVLFTLAKGSSHRMHLGTPKD